MFTYLYELEQQRATAYPTATAVGGQDGLCWQMLDSRQLLNLVDRLAIELAAASVRKGDRVVTWRPNHWRTPAYLFALWKLGAIVVPFDREMNADAARLQAVCYLQTRQAERAPAARSRARRWLADRSARLGSAWRAARRRGVV